jgi:hypothetical protein
MNTRREDGEREAGMGDDALGFMVAPAACRFVGDPASSCDEAICLCYKLGSWPTQDLTNIRSII